MKLILSQQDVELAVRRHVEGLFTISEKAKMDIELIPGRGDKPLTIEVDFNYLSVTSIPGIRSPSIGATVPAQAELDLPKDPGPAAIEGKVDGRSKEARMAKKGGSIFGNAGSVATEPATPEPEQETSSSVPDVELDDAPDLTGDNRAAEAAEILAEPEEEVVVAPPPPTGAPRKSLFS